VPLGTLTATHLIVLGALALVALGGTTVVRRRPHAVVSGALAAGVAVLLSPAVAPPAGAVDGAEVATGARLWRRGAVVLVLDRGEPGRLLDRLRQRGVRRVDVLVSTGGSRTAGGVVAVLRSRLPVRLVLAPNGHRIRDATVPAARSAFDVGGLRLEVGEVRPRLEVVVRPRARDP
jgi:hypothetical protein